MCKVTHGRFGSVVTQGRGRSMAGHRPFRTGFVSNSCARRVQPHARASHRWGRDRALNPVGRMPSATRDVVGDEGASC